MGVVTNPNLKPNLRYLWKSHFRKSIFYDNRQREVRKSENNSFTSPIPHLGEWRIGGALGIILNCEEWTIEFYRWKNSSSRNKPPILLGSVALQLWEGETYYPCFQCCSCRGKSSSGKRDDGKWRYSDFLLLGWDE